MLTIGDQLINTESCVLFVYNMCTVNNMFVNKYLSISYVLLHLGNVYI